MSEQNSVGFEIDNGMRVVVTPHNVRLIFGVANEDKTIDDVYVTLTENEFSRLVAGVKKAAHTVPFFLDA